MPKSRKQPWCTPTIKQYFKRQQQLHKIKIRDPTPENIKKHQIYRNKLNKMIKQEKKKPFTEKIEKTKNDPKQQAKILKSIIPNKKSPRETPHTLIYQNKTLTDQQK